MGPEKTRVPLILQISRESRSEGLRHYHLILYPVDPQLPRRIQLNETNDTRPKFYFNKTLDTLCYGYNTFDPKSTRKDLPTIGLLVGENQIHHLALARRAWFHISDYSRMVWPDAEPWRMVLRTMARSKNQLSITIVSDDLEQMVALSQARYGTAHLTVYYDRGTILKLVPDLDSPFLARDKATWLSDLERFNLLGKLPEPTFAKLEWRGANEF
jgi:hypothetical protein